MTLVYVGAISHAPQITGLFDRADQGQAQRFAAGATAMQARIVEARPDVMVLIASDHFTSLPPGLMPAFTIAMADNYHGPIEDWINLEKRDVPGDAAFALTLVNAALDRGFDPATATSMMLEHGTMIPLHFLSPSASTPIVPVIQNCMVPPLPRLRRCYQFGELIRDASESSERRVAVIGTGGLSHAPGAPEAERIDEEFDRMFLDLLRHGDAEKATRIPSSRVDRAGYGTWEIRQWVTAMGVASGARAEIHVYEPVAAWVTGCAAASFEISDRKAA